MDLWIWLLLHWRTALPFFLMFAAYWVIGIPAYYIWLRWPDWRATRDYKRRHNTKEGHE